VGHGAPGWAALGAHTTELNGAKAKGVCWAAPRGMDRLGRRPHLQLVGQLADLCRRIAPMATKRLQKR
jgi:hypothetical protein